MIRTRMLAAAMLFHDNELLMMKRSMSRTLSPGLWAAVGGHLEPEEINDPEKAVLREIHEETGLELDQIKQLRLRYILHRLNRNEVRQQFIYSAEAMTRIVGQSEEGELHWIPRELVMNRELPFIYRKLLEHYFTYGPSDHVWVGTAGVEENGEPTVHWTPLIDPGQL
ncbi:NUDIX domain-containing protein [Paenibacillus sp. YYML68]|uniref:NUDIX domain-containing protein n=1 Tax=Paenibacillus sp. YYML68 TaxID=2909250 RepID=UPI0024933E9A|nr:NUDIX domain-containing protein [Paenibacillus sp. YYML68]